MRLCFLHSLLGVRPAVEPEAFVRCPVLLVHHAAGRWTTLAASLPFFDRIKGPRELALLANCGHLPVEEHERGQDMSIETASPVALPNVPLAETDGVPLESQWHVLQIGLLIDLLAYWFRDRDDYYAGGNMFLYFSAEQVRNRDYRGPDFFYVDGVSRLPLRPYWAVWQEGGRYPDVIIELLSPTTAEEDRTTKKALYERTFRTSEYFCYDPLTELLEGWRLGPRQRYRALRTGEQGRMEVEELGLWLGTWEGSYQGYQAVWLRFYDAEGRLVPTRGEAEAARAEAEAARAEAEAARASAAEAESARLRERVAELERERDTTDQAGG